MTTSAPPAQLWSSMPGWGIAADLTPPELTNARELNTLRKWLAGGLIALLVLCAAGYVLAARKQSAADAEVNRAQAQTFTLQANERQYVRVTQIQGDVAQLQTQIATLMGSDVDLVALLGDFSTALPTGMKITSEAVNINPTNSSVSPSGATTIAAVVIAGTGHALSDLAAYTAALAVIKGVVDVTPTSNVISGKTSHFSLSLSLTAAAYSHRFDVRTK